MGTMMDKIAYWMGKPVTELDREELLKVVEHCGNEIFRIQKDRDRWMRAGDAGKYMMDTGNDKK
jgi:hypothetical protein